MIFFLKTNFEKKIERNPFFISIRMKIRVLLNRSRKIEEKPVCIAQRYRNGCFNQNLFGRSKRKNMTVKWSWVWFSAPDSVSKFQRMEHVLHTSLRCNNAQFTMQLYFTWVGLLCYLQARNITEGIYKFTFENALFFEYHAVISGDHLYLSGRKQRWKKNKQKKNEQTYTWTFPVVIYLK